MNDYFSFAFHTPTRILFGCDKIQELGKQHLPGKKALLLMSNGQSAKISGAYEKTVSAIELAGVDCVEYAKIMENPTKHVIMEATSLVKENNCDFIIALGGGAVLDSATAISAMATNEGDLWDYICGGTGKGKKLKNSGLPVITIPLTAGTGSEINCWGVISNPATDEKIGFGDSRLFPILSIVDPILMKTVPPSYTAFQGFDALFHHIEVVISNVNSIMSEELAITSIEHIAKYLPSAVRDGFDIEARTHVAYGALLGGITMQLASTTAQHSMEHAMSAVHPNLPHGAGLIMLSTEFFRFFIQNHICDSKFIKMAKALGIKNANKADDFIDALVALQQACNVDQLKMSDYGIKKDECAMFAKKSRETMDILYQATPDVFTDNVCHNIFIRAYK